MLELKNICNDEYMTVSVILPVYNGEGVVKQCLDSLFIQEYPREYYEVLVIDNASTDNTAEIVRSYNVHYIRVEKRGVSMARNRGIREAKGKLLLFLDADCLADSLWIKGHVETHLRLSKTDPEIKAVGGGVAGYNRNFWALCDDFCSWSLYHPGLAPRKEKRYCPTANFSIEKKIIEELGSFNEELHFGEDVALCREITKKGYSIFFEPRAKVAHMNRGSFKTFMEHARNWTKPELLLREKGVLSLPSRNLIFLLFYYIVYILYKLCEPFLYSIMAKRFGIIFLFPFIFLNKIYYCFFKIKMELKYLIKTKLLGRN